MFSIMFVSRMFVLKYSFNTVFINIYYNMLQCQKHSAKLWIILLGGQIFSPSLVYHLLYFFLKNTCFHQQKRVNWFNQLSYKNKCISGLHYFFELVISTRAQRDAALQAGDLIDQVDRERGANRNQSRGIQFIHTKRLTHHPNTRYTLLGNGLLTPLSILKPLACKMFRTQRGKLS